MQGDKKPKKKKKSDNFEIKKKKINKTINNKKIKKKLTI